MQRVLKGNPHYVPKRRRPLCRTCLSPATFLVESEEPRTVVRRDGTVTRSVEVDAAFYCDAHALDAAPSVAD